MKPWPLTPGRRLCAPGWSTCSPRPARLACLSPGLAGPCPWAPCLLPTRLHPEGQGPSALPMNLKLSETAPGPQRAMPREARLHCGGRGTSHFSINCSKHPISFSAHNSLHKKLMPRKRPRFTLGLHAPAGTRDLLPGTCGSSPLAPAPGPLSEAPPPARSPLLLAPAGDGPHCGFAPSGPFFASSS